MSRIKKSVSLYSLQDSYARGRLDLAGVVDFVAGTGASGIELISDQMIVGTPFPSEDTVRDWRAILDRSGLAPVCNDIFVNSTIYRNRTLRVREQVELLERELDVSKRLGFDLVRLVSDTSPEVTEGALQHAERIGVTMALEVHAGMSFGGAVTRRWIEMMRRVQSTHLGLVIDAGIFCQRVPRVSRVYFESIGLSPQVADKVDALYARHGDTARIFGDTFTGGRLDVPADLEELYASPVDAEYAFFSTGYENTPLDVLDEYAQYLRHVHGKIYEITDDGVEYSIDYPAVLSRLDAIGYDGFVSTEYEGNRFVLIDQPVHDQQQVVAHQRLLTSYLEGRNNV